MDFVVSVVSGVVSEIAKHIVVPLLRPIGRPFRPFWRYEDNFQKLETKERELQEKRGELLDLIGDGVEPPEDVKTWLNGVNAVCLEIPVLRREHQIMMNSFCCKVPQCYNHRLRVARVLVNACNLDSESADSNNQWKYMIHVANLKKVVDEDLRREEDRVRKEIKDGERPLPNVGIWLERVITIKPELQGLIHRSAPPEQHLQRPDYSQLWRNVEHKVRLANELLQKAKEFKEISEETEETKYNKGRTKLEKEVKMLELKEKDVRGRIKPGEEPLLMVEKWQGDVKKVMDEVSVLAGEYSEEEQHKLTTLLEEASRLSLMQFTVVARQILPGSINYQFTVMETFHSRLSILKDIIEKLKKNDIHVVGIHGMGGVGKTTLAKQVGVKAISDMICGKVIFAEVSQSPDIKNIQTTVADALGLRLEEGSNSGRATKLYDQLKEMAKEGSKILIVLDNLWEEIKLEEVGIPTDCKDVKLLLTARSHRVLRNEMETQYEFNVEALGRDDAWILFKKSAGIWDNHRLKSTAEKVAQKCGGMPLAIVTLGKALKDVTSENEWKNALERLEIPSPEMPSDITKNIYNSIKLSYDYLSKDLKEIFLLCCCMGTPHNASSEELLRYALGMGKFHELPMERAISRLCTYINRLKDVSLLLNAPETGRFGCFSPPDDSFALHDVVCAVARAIVSKNSMFNELNGDLPVALSNKNISVEYTSITLHNIDRLPVPAEWKCSNLKFLCVKSKYLWLKVTADFFRGMSNLHVLHLIGMDLTPSPVSLSVLENLRTLCLEDCRLEDIVVVRDLKNLQILSFRGSNIKKLSEEMCQLIDLRLLDLRDCRWLIDVPSEILLSLTQMEALYMNNSSTKITVEDLRNLRNLKILEMHIGNVKMCRSLILSKFVRYKIVIGKSRCFRQERNSVSRILKLEYDAEEVSIISQWSEEVEELKLECGQGGAENLLEDLNGTGFPLLMHLGVSYGVVAVCLVKSPCSAALPALESLNLYEMSCLEKICNRSFAANSFLLLKTIEVESCNKLNNIFCFSSFVGVLPNLTDLKAYHCKNMREIFATDRQDDPQLVYDIKLSDLRNLTLWHLPKLKGFYRKAKIASGLNDPLSLFASEFNYLLSLFDEKVEIPNLQNLEVIWNNHVEIIWQNLPTKLSSGLQNLTDLSLSSCGKLRVLFQCLNDSKHEGSTIKLPKLKHLEMYRLPKLTSLCSGCSIQLPLLEDLTVEECDELTSIFDDKDGSTIKLPKLKCLRMRRLPKLTSLCSRCSIQFPLLEDLIVINCDELTSIFYDKDTTQDGSTIKLPKLKHLEMWALPKLTSLCSGCSIQFPLLEDLMVINCDELTSIFDDKLQVPYLKSLKVMNCKKLVTLVRSNMCGRLASSIFEVTSNVEKLRVSICPSLKYLWIPKEVGEEVPLKFVFGKLTTMRLNGLPKLNSFCPSKHVVVEGPALKSLKLWDCGANLLNQVFPCVEELELSGKDIKMYPENMVKKIKILMAKTNELEILTLSSNIQKFQNLETLFLARSHASIDIDRTMEDTDGEGKTLVLHELSEVNIVGDQGSSTNFIFQNFDFQRLVVYRCDRWIQPTRHSDSLQNLTTLTMNDCYELETSLITSTMAESLKKLKILIVRGCFKLKEIAEDPVHLQNLQVLRVFGCFKLNNLIPPSASFPNLTILVVSSCWELRKILTATAVKNLPKLEMLDVSSCHEVREIMKNEGNEMENIVFHGLKTLRLKHFKNLTCFCLGNFTLEFPLLEQLHIEISPRMNSFCTGYLIVPRLQQVQIDDRRYILSSETNLNILLSLHQGHIRSA